MSNPKLTPAEEQELQEIVKPAAKPVTKPTDQSLAISLTPADIQALIVAAIRAAKEPTPEEAAKAQAEKEATAAQREQMRLEGADWKLQRDAMQDNCNHKKPRGEDCFIAKLFSDGVYRIMCLICQKMVREVVATPDMIQAVLQADNVGASSWENFSRAPSGWIDQITPKATA